ncbi:MAG: Hsp20/alpha crystallin family protein [Gammaproteobacteria bacterium]
MKNFVIVIIGLIFIFIFGMQALMFYDLHKTLDRQATLEKESHLSSRQGTNTWIQKSDKWTPYQELLRMRNQMEQLFEDTFSRFQSNAETGTYLKMPSITLDDEPNRYVITVNAPGADESSLNAAVNGRQLTVSVKTENVNENKSGHNAYQSKEQFKGEFQSTLVLPGDVNPASMKTEHKNGVFVITLLKS